MNGDGPYLQSPSESAKSFRPAADLVWDAKGNNTAAVIFLNAGEGDHFKEIAEVSREDLTK